jgi:non-ribosomal peptide synthetase component F
LTHENAVQAMMSFQRLFAGRWTESSRWLQFASYWFDVSVLEQFWSWSVGITLVGAPRDLVLEDLAEFIRTVGITHIDLTPSLARILTPEDVPCLCGGVFITGGEALKQEIIDAWGPKVTVCNGYGPTEATIGVTMNPFVGTDAKPTNIGPAFDNVGSYVFKPDTDEPVWRGAVGELCVFGKLVGKGYLNRPDLTEKAFPYLERLSSPLSCMERRKAVSCACRLRKMPRGSCMSRMRLVAIISLDTWSRRTSSRYPSCRLPSTTKWTPNGSSLSSPSCHQKTSKLSRASLLKSASSTSPNRNSRAYSAEYFP